MEKEMKSIAKQQSEEATMHRILSTSMVLVFIMSQTALALTQADVPSIYKNIVIENCKPVVAVVNDPESKLFLDPGQATPDYTLAMLSGNPVGTDTGFTFTFKDSGASESLAGGTLWGYIMDNQLEWLKSTLATLQADSNIDHIFVTHHTPAFPNGGHVNHYNSMWMKGENHTPIINGTPVKKFLDDGKGSLDRRDEYIRTLLPHTKVKAILVGDEHNYSRLLIKPGMPVYKKVGYRPDNPLTITRNLWHITVGSAGAPYYAKESAPWNQHYPQDTEYLKFFSPQHAVAFFHVHGPSLKLEVVNPDTLDRIE
jgi:3',5'-cyclic AMP phosphodiesterase CpdA